MPSPLEVNEPYPEIDEVVEPLTEWEKFDTISGVDHGADEELEDALQADIMKNENEREREEEIESSEETETSGYYKKFAKDTSSGDGKYPLSPFTQSLRKWTNVTPTFGSAWFRPAAPKSEPPFKLCIARISNCKAVSKSVHEPSHKEFMHMVGMYLYHIRRSDWIVKVFVDEEAYERNQFHVLARDQEVGTRFDTFTHLIQPFLKSGQFCYVGIYHPEIAVYRGVFPVTKYTPHDDPERLTFHGPDGGEQDIIDFAKVVYKLTGVDPQTSADGVIIGTGHYRPDENNRYRLWNSALNHHDWVQRIFNEIDTKEVFVFLPNEIPDFELYIMRPYDAVVDLQDDSKVSTNAHDYSRSDSTPRAPTYLRQTLPPFEKKKGTVRWDRAHEWYEARREMEIAKTKKAYEEVKKGPELQKPSLPYDGMKKKLADLRNDLQDIEGENAKNRFIAQQLLINEEWQRLRNSHLTPERVYGAGGKIGIPVYGNTVEEVITGGPKLPTTYARILTAAEVEELQNRLTRVENELLMREEFCRVCDQNFTYGYSALDVKAHYAEHRVALAICERRNRLLTPSSDEENEGEEETEPYDSAPMGGISVSKSPSWKDGPNVEGLYEEGPFSLFPDKEYEVDMLTGVTDFHEAIVESDSESDGEPVPRDPSDFVLNPEIWRATPNASPEIPAIRQLKPSYPEEMVSGRKRVRSVAESSEDEVSEPESGSRSEEDDTFDPSKTRDSGSEEEEEGVPEDITETSTSEPKRKKAKTEKKLKIEKKDRKDSDGEFVAGDEEEDEDDEDSGLPTPGVDEPVAGEEDTEESLDVKAPKKGKKAKGKTGKTEEKGDGVFKPGKSTDKDEDETVEIDGEAGAAGNQGKKKYCPACWKCVHSFGKQKLRMHLKACKVREEDIMWATKDKASLMKEKLELEGSRGGKGKAKGKGKK